jgi:hypothetical protein
MLLRRFEASDAGVVWALNALPNVGSTADRTVPLELTAQASPPLAFPYLADIDRHFVGAGGEFLILELTGHVVGMGGIRRSATSRRTCRWLTPSRRATSSRPINLCARWASDMAATSGSWVALVSRNAARSLSTKFVEPHLGTMIGTSIGTGMGLLSGPTRARSAATPIPT